MKLRLEIGSTAKTLPAGQLRVGRVDGGPEKSFAAEAEGLFEFPSDFDFHNRNHAGQAVVI